MADIVEDFEKALDGLSATQQSGVFTTLGLTRSVADQLATLVGTSEKIRQYEADLRLMGDVTQEVADKQLQSFSNQMALTRAQFTNIALTIGEALAGPLRQFNLWLREQTPAIEAFVNDAIPKIAEFARNAVAKFREFKDAFQTNVIDPINAFLALPTTVAFFAEFEAEFNRFTERLRNLGADLRAAIDEENPEAVGMVLGEFVAEVFRTAFGRAEVIGEAIKEAFGGQDWTEIGKAVGAVAVDFLKGFAIGLFSKPEVMDDELEKQSRTLTAMFTENFVSTFLGALILTRLPIIGAPVRLLLRPFLIGFSLLGTKIASFIPAVFGSKIIGALVLAIRAILFPFVAAFAVLASKAAVVIRVFGALLGFHTTASAMMSAELIRTFFRGTFLNRIWSGLAFAFKRLLALGIVGAVKALGGILAGIVTAVGGWPVIIVAAAILAFAEFIRRFGKWNEEQGDEYEGFGAKIVAFIGQGVQKMAGKFMETVGKWFGDRWDDTKTLLGKIPWSDLGGDIIMGVVRGIWNKNVEIGDALLTAARDAWERTKAFFKSRSPSMLFAGLGEDLMLGMAKGINESASVVADAMRDVSVDTANVRFSAPDVPLMARTDEQGNTVINVTVTSADPQAVVEALRRYTRANGPLGSVVNV
jgi:hypothetical protein